MLRKSPQIAVFAILCAVSVSACGEDREEPAAVSQSFAERTDEEGQVTEQGPEGTTEPELNRTYVIGYEASDGSTAEATVELGELERLEDAVQVYYSITCFNDEVSRAAIVPGRAIMTNTTPGFTADLSMALEIPEASGGDGGTDPIMDSEAGDCRQGISWLEHEEASPGESLGPVEFGVIFPDYYSPSNPEGDSDSVTFWDMSIESTFDFDESCISGPGVEGDAEIPIARPSGSEPRSGGSGTESLPPC